jgi:hypothetical protein
MKTRTKIIALVGVAAVGAYAANKIRKTQSIKPSVSASLPESPTVLPKVPPRSGLSKTMIASYITQIAEMTKTLDPDKTINLVHYLATDPNNDKETEVILVAAGYEMIAGPARTMFKKSVKADAQTILDAVVFVAETAKTHKLKYLGWDFSE